MKSGDWPGLELAGVEIVKLAATQNHFEHGRRWTKKISGVQCFSSHEVSALNSLMPPPNLDIGNENIRECSQRGSGDSGQKWEDGG